MLKKTLVILLALIVSAASLTACSDPETVNDASSSETSAAESLQSEATGSETTENSSSEEDGSEMFADGDFREAESEEANAEITLSGDQGTISDTTRGSSGNDVTITSKGIYRISGSSQDVSIIVNDDSKSGNIYLILDNVEMTNSSKPCIYVEASEKVIICCVGDNSLEYTAAESSEGLDGAIFSKDDVTLNGSGTLSLSSQLHGIVCKDDFKITGATVNVTAGMIGIKAGDSVRIGGGETVIDSEHDGIQVQNKSGSSFLYTNDGTVTLNSGYDGIDVGTSDADFTGYVNLSGGKIDITSGGGSDNSKDSETSQKGIKCDGDIIFGDAELTVSSADDSVNSDGSVTVSGGSVSLSTSDDGITALSAVNITGGTVGILKSYEGIEAESVTIDGGSVSVVSSDDGINTAGGSDSASEEEGPWGESSSGTLTINAGEVYVNSSGDGLDSNGSIYITGGTVIVEGPTDNGNGAIDKGDGQNCTASITGGTLIAIGSSGMAVNFDSGTQCSALVSLSGDSGTEITVDDGSGFTFTSTKKFECVLYSSPEMTQENKYTITAGTNSAEADFSSGLYYSDVSSSHGIR